MIEIPLMAVKKGSGLFMVGGYVTTSPRSGYMYLGSSAQTI